MFYRFEATVPLRWVDVDSAGIVNNAVFLTLMEQARFAYFEHLGLLTGHRVPFVLAEVTVKFLRPGRLGMVTTVAAGVRSLGTSSFRMEYEVRGGDEVLATGQAVLVFVDERMQPQGIPGEVRSAIEQFEQMDGG